MLYTLGDQSRGDEEFTGDNSGANRRLKTGLYHIYIYINIKKIMYPLCNINIKCQLEIVFLEEISNFNYNFYQNLKFANRPIRTLLLIFFIIKYMTTSLEDQQLRGQLEGR